MSKTTISLAEALEIINANNPPSSRLGREALEAWLRRTIGTPCPFGVYVKQDGCERGSYIIFAERLRAYLEADDIKLLGSHVFTQSEATS